jgi:hypothetical protein
MGKGLAHTLLVVGLFSAVVFFYSLFRGENDKHDQNVLIAEHQIKAQKAEDDFQKAYFGNQSDEAIKESRDHIANLEADKKKEKAASKAIDGILGDTINNVKDAMDDREDELNPTPRRHLRQASVTHRSGHHLGNRSVHENALCVRFRFLGGA